MKEKQRKRNQRQGALKRYCLKIVQLYWRKRHEDEDEDEDEEEEEEILFGVDYSIRSSYDRAGASAVK